MLLPRCVTHLLHPLLGKDCPSPGQSAAHDLFQLLLRRVCPNPRVTSPWVLTLQAHTCMPHLPRVQCSFFCFFLQHLSPRKWQESCNLALQGFSTPFPTPPWYAFGGPLWEPHCYLCFPHFPKTQRATVASEVPVPITSGLDSLTGKV